MLCLDGCLIFLKNFKGKGFDCIEFRRWVLLVMLFGAFTFGKTKGECFFSFYINLVDYDGMCSCWELSLMLSWLLNFMMLFRIWGLIWDVGCIFLKVGFSEFWWVWGLIGASVCGFWVLDLGFWVLIFLIKVGIFHVLISFLFLFVNLVALMSDSDMFCWHFLVS